MAREVFVDTSALYGLIDRRDSGHAHVSQSSAKLARAGHRFVTTDFIIAETINLATARQGSTAGVEVLDYMDRTLSFRIERIDADRFDTAGIYYRKHADHTYSFTDCTSFVVMEELRLADVLTLDRHFREASFTIL